MRMSISELFISESKEPPSSLRRAGHMSLGLIEFPELRFRVLSCRFEG